jgi:hypothetical protein
MGKSTLPGFLSGIDNRRQPASDQKAVSLRLSGNFTFPAGIAR